jgi:DNA-binding GntR family transcriptional regulator
MSERRSAIDHAVARLRELAGASEDGAFLGSEDSLVEKLGASRATVRQVARLLEREGRLRVRRGINGGYFAARPDLDTVEAAVSGYLETLDMDAQDVTVVASVLWVEALRKAASAPTDAAAPVVAMLRERLSALRADAPFATLVELEKEFRTEIFALTKARYIELIFQINIAFARTRFPQTSAWNDVEAHRRFVDTWRKAKLMELDAIADGDAELAMMAARHSRNLWHQRIWDGRAAQRKLAVPEAAPAADAEPPAARRGRAR